MESRLRIGRLCGARNDRNRRNQGIPLSDTERQSSTHLRRQGRAAVVGSVKGPSPERPKTTGMRRFQTFPPPPRKAVTA